MTDVGLERLTSLTNLRALTMGGNELGDAGMQALRQMPNLTYLDLSGRQGNDKNVWSIAMSNTGLQAVLTLKNLRELRFACVSTSVGVEGNKLGEVSTLSITEKWLEQLKSLTALERLKLQGCGRINDESVATLIHAVPSRSGSEGHRGHGKRRRHVPRGQAKSHSLYRYVGRQSRRLSEQLSALRIRQRRCFGPWLAYCFRPREQSCSRVERPSPGLQLIASLTGLPIRL